MTCCHMHFNIKTQMQFLFLYCADTVSDSEWARKKQSTSLSAQTMRSHTFKTAASSAEVRLGFNKSSTLKAALSSFNSFLEDENKPINEAQGVRNNKRYFSWLLSLKIWQLSTMGQREDCCREAFEVADIWAPASQHLLPQASPLHFKVPERHCVAGRWLH